VAASSEAGVDEEVQGVAKAEQQRRARRDTDSRTERLPRGQRARLWPASPLPARLPPRLAYLWPVRLPPRPASPTPCGRRLPNVGTPRLTAVAGTLAQLLENMEEREWESNRSSKVWRHVTN
jgi:hypothetical protein